MDPKKPSALVRAVDFEGHRITVVVWEGRPVWIASQVGEALGYPNGGARFADKIRGEWSEEFIDGVDFEVLTNGKLAAFRLASDSTKTVESLPREGGARSLVILTESGLHLALLKTRKPAGQRLRRLLATEVLPQLARTGRYAPEAPALPPPAPAPPALPPGETLPPVRLKLVREIAPRIAELYAAGDVRAAKIAAGLIERLMRRPKPPKP